MYYSIGESCRNNFQLKGALSPQKKEIAKSVTGNKDPKELKLLQEASKIYQKKKTNK